VILLTAEGTTDTAIEAMKLGAYEYLLKPCDTEELKRVAAAAVEAGRLVKEVVALPDSLTPIRPPAGDAVRLVGAHREMQEVFKLIGQVAEKDVTVLITGESGTGKELVARAIGRHSLRRDKPFLAVNCAAIPDSLFESELFGHERGAFTGADRAYAGRFERCHTGTLFFDEIGDMSLGTQAKVLRVLQEGTFERLGSSEPIRVDVRIIAATNKDLEREVEAGRFREDLFYRLKIIAVHMPPLRSRASDIPALVDHFVGRFARDYGKPLRYISDQAMRTLQAYDWPGNVRELENCLRRAVLMCKGDVLLADHLRLEEGAAAAASAAADPLEAIRARVEQLAPEILRIAGPEARESLIDLVEKVLLRQALEDCGHNQVHAARRLGISRNTLRHRIEKYRLEPDETG
jgi:DNA-binding NtrC family response regulator